MIDKLKISKVSKSIEHELLRLLMIDKLITSHLRLVKILTFAISPFSILIKIASGCNFSQRSQTSLSHCEDQGTISKERHASAVFAKMMVRISGPWSRAAWEANGGCKAMETSATCFSYFDVECGSTEDYPALTSIVESCSVIQLKSSWMTLKWNR